VLLQPLKDIKKEVIGTCITDFQGMVSPVKTVLMKQLVLRVITDETVHSSKTHKYGI
jgi:hypothetical protein